MKVYHLNMRKRMYALLTMVVILLLAVSCGTLPTGSQAGVEEPPKTQTQSGTGMPMEQEDLIPHDVVFRGSSFLIQMDDLKAINMAANYLKELGETVTFQETYIEYHDAGKTAANISLASGQSVDYMGDYLEVRLYQSNDPEEKPCEHCTVIYISQDGKILGQNKVINDDSMEEDIPR